MKLIIIGGGVAGFRVAALANQKCPDLETIVITAKSHGVVSTCGIPFGLETLYELEKLILATPEYYAEKGIKVMFETEATKIDLSKNQVDLKNLNHGDIETLDYDYLVIATGRTPFIPPIPGVELEGVFTLSNYEDAQQIEAYLLTSTVQKAVIIGAGPIGMEIAWALNKRGLEATVVELLPSVFPQSLDPDMAELVQNHYEESGIKILTKTPVTGIYGENSHAEYVTVGDNEDQLQADIVIISTGIRPNVALAREAGLELGQVGGLITDNMLRVRSSETGETIPNVNAVGDCIQVVNGITNQPMLSALASTVVPEARVIIESINLSAQNSDLESTLKFESCLSPNITVVGGLEVGALGLTTHAATKAGLNNLVIGKSSGNTRSGYFPGNKKIHIKLLFDSDTLVGAQVVGGEGVKARIDPLTVAIRANLKLNDLLLMERSFTPPLAMLVDPIIGALEMAREELKS